MFQHETSSIMDPIYGLAKDNFKEDYLVNIILILGKCNCSQIHVHYNKTEI